MYDDVKEILVMVKNDNQTMRSLYRQIKEFIFACATYYPNIAKVTWNECMISCTLKQTFSYSVQCVSWYFKILACIVKL